MHCLLGSRERECRSLRCKVAGMLHERGCEGCGSGSHLCRARSVPIWAPNLTKVCSSRKGFSADTRTTSSASAGTTYHQAACSSPREGR